MTGSDVKTRLYSRMNVYWYRYVASKLLKIMNQNIANVQMTFYIIISRISPQWYLHGKHTLKKKFACISATRW